MAKPKPPQLRNLGNELGQITSDWSSSYPGRNGLMLGATTGNLDSILAAMESGRAGEMGANAAWLRKHAGVLRSTGRDMTAATNMATAPTALGGQLDSSASAALSDPTGGNPMLGRLMSSSGPDTLLKTMQGQAQTDLSSNGALNPEQTMQAQQAARAAYASNGFNLGSPVAAAEILNRSNAVQARQDRARAFASGVEGMSQNQRGQDLQLGATMQDAINSGRAFATGVNAQDLNKQQADLAARSNLSQFKLSTDPSLMAYNTNSMVPGALSAGMTTAQAADVYPQMMQYGSDVYNTNFNALESRYNAELNREAALQAGQMSLAGSGQAANASMMSAGIGAAGAIVGGGLIIF